MNKSGLGSGATSTGRGGPGNGGGRGAGAGAGAGAGIGRVAAATRAPAPSKARKARLIWPKRQGEPEQGRLFTCLLTVDEDGFVVGVKLLRGPRGRRAERAADAVWRFRYDPARDDAGKPVASQVEQPFVLLN